MFIIRNSKQFQLIFMHCYLYILSNGKMLKKMIEKRDIPWLEELVLNAVRLLKSWWNTLIIRL
ncbi:hypothetical protein GO599_10080 [Sulfolobus islandicus]|uniref:Uncharacterized protein n=2 Tax=Saccharolobus islandicus TaxID=43080 RepID=M9UH15_SACIS|nr:Hypothetical Protein SiL_2052 [Sulfolobus islandicus LAL14/1]WCM37765.1 hypothetical protein GO599_10080 [Sulfolobus islandicus]